MAEKCTCLKCPTCDGTGTYYVGLGGRYEGAHRSHDLQDPEYCEYCDGGVIEECAKCFAQREGDSYE